VTGTGDARVVRDGLPVRLGEVPAGRWVSEAAADRDWKLDARGFWQVHPGAVDALVSRVRENASVRTGDHVLDLYAGAGLFAAALSSDVAGLQVDAVEADVNAVAGARRSLHDLPGISLHQERVDVWLRSGACPSSVDVVVLDPPRAGAGKEVLVPLAALGPRVIAFVACDPAALARDVGILRGQGYRLASLRAFDLFPMTHHVECVAEFVPGEQS
jgi:tRNA/tmRNA/rRNA uracil-C5-methylase (TrmA/RlmC/RlmD family)